MSAAVTEAAFSFAGGGAAFIMTGTLYGNANYNWNLGFFFGAGLESCALALSAD